VAGQFERRPVDDGRIVAAFPRQHGGRHGLGAPLRSRAMIGLGDIMIHRRPHLRRGATSLRRRGAAERLCGAQRRMARGGRGMDVRSRQPVTAGRERMSRWPDEPAQAPIKDRAASWRAAAGRAVTARVPLVVTLAIFVLAFLLPTWPWLSGEVTIPWDAKSQF